MIPFTPSIIHKLKGANIIPLGIADQFTVNEDGDKIQKLRITHDCSWEGMKRGNHKSTMKSKEHENF